jgi:hypothetical protein
MRGERKNPAGASVAGFNNPWKAISKQHEIRDKTFGNQQLLGFIDKTVADTWHCED